MHRDYCTPEGVHTLLADTEKSAVIFDFRSPDDYSVSHIRGSINLQLSLILRRRLQKDVNVLATVVAAAMGDNADTDAVAAEMKRSTVLLYDQNSDTLECLAGQSGSSVPVVFKKLSDSGADVRLLKGGFAAFHEKYPEDCQGTKSKPHSPGGHPTKEPITGLRNLHISNESNDVSSSTPYSGISHSPPRYDPSGFPVQVLPFLFLGNAVNAHDRQCLKDHDIRHILNVTHDVRNEFEDDGVEYLKLPIEDKCSEDLSMHFEQAIGFIDRAIRQEHGILVHCLAGVSRSVTIVIAYIMKTEHLNLDEAFDFVRRKKTNISPNFTFMNQLQDLEASLGLTPQTRHASCADTTDGAALSDNSARLVVSGAEDSEGNLGDAAELTPEDDDCLGPCPYTNTATGAFSCTPSSGTSSSSSANDSSAQKFSYHIFDKTAKYS